MDSQDGHLTPEGEDNHVLIGITCWCKPEVVWMDSIDYILHKDKNGNTILTDPKVKKDKLVN